MWCQLPIAAANVALCDSRCLHQTSRQSKLSAENDAELPFRVAANRALYARGLGFKSGPDKQKGVTSNFIVSETILSFFS